MDKDEIEVLAQTIVDCIKIDGEVRLSTVIEVISMWIACGRPTAQHDPQAQG